MLDVRRNVMLLKAMIEKLASEFPTLKYSVNETKRLISIPAKNDEVGGVDIQDDEFELTVYVGNFTHWHVGCYDDELSEKEKAQDISEQVVEFLTDLFNDQVVMWGNNSVGGFYLKSEKPKIKSWFGFGKKKKEWVWSGAINS